jgi:hypothetical protein
VKLDRATARDFAFAQLRAWSCYFIYWAYSVQDFHTITGFLGFLLFLVATEYFYRIIKAIFILKGKL